MSILAAIRKLRHFISPRTPADIEEEFHSTLDAYQEDLVRQGFTEEQARRKARIDLGRPTAQNETYRKAIGLGLFDELSGDIRYGFRAMRRNPGFATVAVLSLALGTGATTAIFSIVEGVLLRPLPFTDPERLMVLGDTVPRIDMGSSGHIGVTMPQILTYERETRGFAALGGFEQASYEFSDDGAPAKISASRVTASVFPLLGVAPLMGRTFTQQEDDRSQPVTVISYAMWHSHFNEDPQILGRKIELNRKTYEIIGVMPRGFEFPLIPGQMDQSRLWVPLSPTPDEMEEAAAWCCGMVGRLKPGVTPSQAQQDAERVARQIAHNFPAYMSNQRIGAMVRSLAEETVAQARPLLRILLLAVAVVLFIACANLAGLLLVRVIRRRREIAVRRALGASGAALLRQSLVETLALSLAGGLIGLSLAALAVRVGISFLPETLPRVESIQLDWHVVLFAIGTALLTGLLCGLVPALAAARTGVNETLKEGGRTGSAGGAQSRLRSALVVAEIAVALVLLIASGLLLRSFEKLREVDVGFRTDHLLTANYNLPQEQYSRQAAIDTFNSTLLRRLERLPGIDAVGITSYLPASGMVRNSGFVADSYVLPKATEVDIAWPSQVMGNYFRAAEIPLLRGRVFTEADNVKAPPVCIVNHMLAEHFWSGQDPIGKRLRWGYPNTPTPWITVVGVMGDIKQMAVDAPTQYEIYQPSSQVMASYGKLVPPGLLNAQAGSIVLRTALPLDSMIESLRATALSIDPQLPLTKVQSMDEALSRTEAPRRFNAVLISSFAAAAVLLALMGIYSVIALSAAMRTQEMAIRIALGSQRADIVRLVLTSGAKLAVIGVPIGLVGAAAASRLLRSFLFQVSPFDPGVLALAAIAVFALALLASALPARRAAAVDPIGTLRDE
ncbi:ABC transporter permease [Occallatibacter savannae]|uniref:ABC transporter permease n=1 Tax=Occallatibacter savannae TaxID=1002691 RepID=UPI000D69BE9B|nr:ABC transporter permease [Occallatibacter savannae]